MPRKKKRRLTKDEIEEIREWMEKSPHGNKPNIRQIAKRYGVNQPSVVKSLGGWKGIKRGKPEPPPRSEFGEMLRGVENPQIPGYTTEIELDNI
ncbi:hypothetical protein KKF61_06920 [Patescibacteria group bacterium]|nr:hypothetical protein [Patescibacteria group bacterium]